MFQGDERNSPRVMHCCAGPSSVLLMLASSKSMLLSKRNRFSSNVKHKTKICAKKSKITVGVCEEEDKLLHSFKSFKLNTMEIHFDTLLPPNSHPLLDLCRVQKFFCTFGCIGWSISEFITGRHMELPNVEIILKPLLLWEVCYS